MAIFCIPARAQQAVLTDDSHVSTTTPNTADGGAQIMRVRAGVDRAFLKFSVGPNLLPSGTVGMFVGKATLKVFVNTVNVGGTLQVAPATAGTAWSESTLTNNNAPTLGATAATASVTTGEKWVTFDVTSLVQQWIDTPASNNGLALLGTGTTDLEIDAKEDIPFVLGGGLVLSGHPAQLEITLNHAATADAATLASNANNLGGTPAANYVKQSDPVLTAPRTPLPGSPSYIQNATVQQPLSNFNISGNGTVGGVLSASNADVGLTRTLATPNVRLNIHGSGIQTEARIQDDSERAILSLDSTISGQRRVYTVENGIFGTAGLFGVYDRTAAQLRFAIDPAGKANIPGNLDIGLATAPEPSPEDNVKLRVHGGPASNGTGGGLTEAKIQSDNERAILSLDSTIGGQRQDYTIENGVFGTAGLFGIYDRTHAGIRFSIDATGAVNIPLNLTVGQTLSANTLSLNVVDAKQQFNLGGQRFATQAGVSFTGSTFVGRAAGQNETLFPDGEGRQNTFIGNQAGLANTIGERNSFVGADAGAGNTIGNFNAALGYFAGGSNAAGSLNAFLGTFAGGNLTGGSENSFVGVNAGGYGFSGTDNTFLGFASGFSTDQRNNGQANNMGTNNTLLGARTGLAIESLDHAAAIGADAIASTSNTIVLGRSSGADSVQVPGSLSANTVTTNTFSANTLNAKTEFDLGGTRFLSANPGVLNIAVGGGLVAPGANNSMFGTRSGLSITTGNANSFFGDTAGQNDQDGSRNSFFGSAAGFLNQSGTDNAFVGFFSGSSNNGSFNSFFGSRAGRDSNTGSENSFFGASAGQSNTGGEFNAFFGDFSGYSSSLGISNSFFGSSAGYSVINGSGNSFVGTQAGNSNANGNYNSIFGSFAGSNYDSSLGSGNVLVGGFSEETFWDFFYDPSFFTGPNSQNVFVGLHTGHGNKTGSSDTLLGSLTDVGSNNLSFATAIGAGAVVNTSNTITLGRSIGADTVQIPGMVAIGSAAATAPLTVLGLIETDSAAGGVKFPDGSVQKTAGITGNVVHTLNGLFNDVTLTPGSPNVIIAQAGNNISIAAHADATAILNQTTQQAPANFNIDGTGTAGALLATSYIATGDYRDAGGDTPILNDFGGNLRVGPTAGLGVGGSLNTYVGSNAGANSGGTGDQNSFLGYHAGQGATSGDGGNSFVGAFSGPLNHGDNNSFFGRNTGLSSDTGSNNTLLGANSNVAVAGLTNATAIGAGAIVGASNSMVLGNNVNVGIGTAIPTSRLTVAGVMESTTGGVKFPDGTIQTSAAVGASGPYVKSLNGLNNDVVLSAGSNITITPSGNTLTISSTGGGSGGGSAILNQTALQSSANFNIDGFGRANTFDALSQYNLGGARVLSIPGQDNLFIGSGAGSIPDPFGDNIENVFVGTQSGPLTTECCNAFFGNYTGKNNKTGQVNTFIGYQAGDTNVQGSDNTFVGANAGVGHTTGDGNTFIGDSAGVGDISGLNNTYIGRATGGAAALTGPHPGSPGAYNTFLGTNATATQPANLTYATAIGAGSVVDDNNKIVLGRTTDLVSVPGTFTNPSDLRLKTGVTDLGYGLREVMRLRPVSWNWKSDPRGRTQMGLIAQEVRSILPELVIAGTDSQQMLSMNYLGLVPVLIRAIQEQEATIQQLKSELAGREGQGSMLRVVRADEQLAEASAVYTGDVTTDQNGDAVVMLPPGFEALNRQFRYQLTVVGKFAQAIIASEIQGNRFTIKTDKPGVKVCWQVTSSGDNPRAHSGTATIALNATSEGSRMTADIP